MKKSNYFFKFLVFFIFLFAVFSCAVPGAENRNENDQAKAKQLESSEETLEKSRGSWPVLKTGSKGHDVTTLQYFLNGYGISCSVDGDFGNKTKSAVTTIQGWKGLTQDGIVGENTWKALFVTIKKGEHSNIVKALQYQLKYKFNYSLTIDGDFGNGTKNAVLSFQANCGLIQDGIVGKATWEKLIRGSGSNGNTNPDFTYENIRNAIKRKGYKFFTGDYNVNLVGIRTRNRIINDKWDDYFCLLYQVNGVNKIKVYKDFTVDPGSYYTKVKLLNSKGCAIVVPGQYRGVWKIGKHKGKYTALVQKGYIKVYRDGNKNSTLDMKSSTIMRGMFGINLHHGGNSSRIGKYSAGCQVFRYKSKLNEVLSICRKASSRYGNSFTYTLLNINDL